MLILGSDLRFPRTHSRAQSSRLAEFGGRGMSFNICRGTLGSLVMFTALRFCRLVKLPVVLECN